MFHIIGQEVNGEARDGKNTTAMMAKLPQGRTFQAIAPLANTNSYW